MRKSIFIVAYLIAVLACGSPSANDAANSSTAPNTNLSGTPATAGARAETPTPAPTKTETTGDGTVVNVKFERGASEATYTRKFSGYGYVDFVLDAKANQQMTAEITRSDNDNAILTVMKNGEAVEEDAAMVQGWTGILPETGRYMVRVGQMRNEARRGDTPIEFTLLIRIVN